MKKVKTKSLEHFLKEIDEIKEKAAELNKFENNVDNLLKNFNNPESESFAWLENSPICTKIIDLDFNLKYMSKAGIEKLRIENIPVNNLLIRINRIFSITPVAPTARV